VDLLDSPDWNIRLAAARALGYISYEPAVKQLVGLLQDPTDVRLNWVAAESLGRLQAREAQDALRTTADNHWYPPVRTAAETALHHIRDGTDYPVYPHNFAFEFFAYFNLNVALEACQVRPHAFLQQPVDRKLHPDSPPERLTALSFPVMVESIAPMNEVPTGPKTEILRANEDGTVEYRGEVSVAPQVALRTPNGWLAGTNFGEWGGHLVYVGDDGGTQLIIEENIADLHELEGHPVAVAGLAHMFSNNGLLYEVRRAADGSWNARPWRALPGAPGNSGLIDARHLLVFIYGGGAVLVGADGTMRMAPCEDS